MQNDNSNNNNNNNNNNNQQASNGAPAAPANQQQQQQYRAAMQQQQMAAMQAASRPQPQPQNPANGANAGVAQPGQARPSVSQAQQQAQSLARPPQQGGGVPAAATQAQMQALQQLFQNHPEQLAAFVNLSREGKISAEHIAQLRGVVSAAQQAQQTQSPQPVAATPGQQQARPTQQANPQANQSSQPIRQTQSPQQPAAQTQQQPQRPQQQLQAQQQAPSQQQPQQTQSVQPQQQASVRPSNQARPPVQAGQNGPPDFKAIMQHLQKVAEPIVRRVRELESALQKPADRGGVAPGPDRTRLETELSDVKQRQSTLGHKYLAAKAQLLQQQGQTQEAQQIMQSLQQRTAAAASAGQAPNAGTPPQGARPPSRPPPGDGSQPAGTPGSQSAQLAGTARGSPATNVPPAGVPGAAPGGGVQPGVHPQQVQPVPQPSMPPEAMVQRPAGSVSQAGTTIPAQLNVNPSVPEPYPNNTGPRPTLSQGLGTNPLLGTPAILQRPDPVAGTSGAAAGSTSAAAGQTNNWEELLGVTPREVKGASGLGVDTKMSTVNTDELANDMANPDFWDTLTGRGTGAESLLNAGSASATGATGVAAVGTASDGRLLSKRKVQELVGEIDPNERLEGAVEDLLLEIADEFIDSVTQFGCRLAKHRKGDRLEVRDVQLHLERSWNLRIPTPGSVPIPPPRIKTATQPSGGSGKAGGGAAAASAGQ